MSLQRETHYSEDRERALTLAKTGDYAGWPAVCRKMLFDGWPIDMFNDVAFTEDVDLACSSSRAVRLVKFGPAETHA